VNNFEELEWTWARIENGEEADSAVINYQHAGSETIEGVETNQLIFTLDGEKFKLWVDKSGNVVQAEAGGKIIQGNLVDATMDSMLSGIFWPFWAAEEIGIHESLVDTTPGVKWNVVSIEKEQFGDIGAEVTRLEVKVGPPLTPEGEEGTAIWSVGDFNGDFQMLVKWDWTETAGGEDLAVTYSLNKIVPR